MSKQTGDDAMLERRRFLKGSALFAASFALGAAAPAAAQAPQPPAPAEDKKEETKEEPPKKDGAENQPKPLLDDQGREYRVCEICGANMYKDGNTWACEQCGYSYEE